MFIHLALSNDNLRGHTIPCYYNSHILADFVADFLTSVKTTIAMKENCLARHINFLSGLEKLFVNILCMHMCMHACLNFFFWGGGVEGGGGVQGF